MIPSQKEKLIACNQTYLSIGISENGTPVNGISIPWVRDSSAFNMRIPDLFLCEDDLYNSEILSLLKSHKVIGFYAFCGLRSYSVLAQFTDLQDIHLRHAENLSDLSFIEKMHDWFMLFIQGAKLDNLDPLVYPAPGKGITHSYCLGFYDCPIDDISSLVNSSLRPYELLIWDKWDEAEDNRWKQVRALNYRYFRLKGKQEAGS